MANRDQRMFTAVEDPQTALLRKHHLLLDQEHHLYHSMAGLQLYEEGKDSELVEMTEESERERAFQRARSLDNQLCRGELPPLTASVSVLNHHHPVGLAGASPYGHGGSPFPDNALPHATSSPHAKQHPNVKSPTAVSHSPLTSHSPSISTLTLMKKQISEIEREIALKKPDGGVMPAPRRSPCEGDVGPPPNLDLHLLDPLSEFALRFHASFQH